MSGFATTESQDTEFQAFLSRGEVKLQRCRQCATVRHPPRWICAECLSEEYDWEEISGEAEVECFTWYLRPFDPRCADVPYNVALVRLAEGPGLIANILDVELGGLSVGQRVRPAVTRIGPERWTLNFVPDDQKLGLQRS